MSLDNQYPEVGKLAKRMGYASLNDYATSRALSGTYLNLQMACVMVRSQFPHAIGAADHWSYLRTLDEFLRCFTEDEVPRKTIWRKLNSPSQSSEFLDTISEIVWALHFKEVAGTVRLEVPFDPSTLTGKNADVVVTLSDGSLVWKDVISIQPSDELFCETSPFPKHSRDEILNLFHKRAGNKYDSKFREAVASNLVESAGVLLCILKCEELMAPFLLEELSGAHMPDAAISLWTDHPKLDEVVIHTLQKARNSDMLIPYPLLTWHRPIDQK